MTRAGAHQPAATDRPPAARAGLRGLRRAWPWGLLALPGLGQVALLLVAILGRVAYPFDLEWMEGGLLLHAHRLSQGLPLYPPPSIEFIPYLYTPLYPALIAGLGSIFGVSYLLGRALSVLAIGAVLALTAVITTRGTPPRRERDRPDHAPAPADSDARPIGWCGAALGAGLFAATYPWVEGWYDLVRADTLFLALILAGLVWLSASARRGQGLAGQRGVAGAAALLGLSFFCKQTGVLYVAVGGALLLAWNWRRVPIYVVTAGVVGLGGTAILNRATDGWFWTYIYEVHQAHDFNMDRFWLSFAHILGHFPAMTAAAGVGLLAVAVTAVARRRLAAGGATFLAWSFVFAASCVVGAIGWGTQWAHFNAYMPAMLTGGLAAGCALPALFGCARAWQRRPTRLAAVAPAVVAALLGVQLVWAAWDPRAFIPTQRDEDAGHALIEHLRALRQDGGDLYMPYHPWYPHLAGQESLYTHRMGLMDMAYGNRWQVAGLRQAFRDQRFSAVILDNRPPGWEMPELTRHYRPDERLPGRMRPRLYTGAKVVPHMVWVPIEVEPPAGARALFDFEGRRLRGWDIDGAAWGRRPVKGPLPGQGQVSRYRGRAYLSSMHRGDESTGTLTSPPFTIAGARLTFLLSGGADPEHLRVELHLVDPPSSPEDTPAAADPADTRPERRADTPDQPAADPDDERAGSAPVRVATNDIDSERMRTITWDLGPYRGRQARLVLIDQATGSWGHLNVDDFLLWPE